MTGSSRYMTILFTAATPLLLNACAVRPAGEDPAYKQHAAVEKYKQEVKQTKETLEEEPDWFKTPPADDSFMMYEVGSARSGDLQLAIDKAVLDAKYSLAARLQGKMSGKMKKFIEESGTANDLSLIQETTKVTSSLFTDVNMAGYSIAKKKLIQQDSGFRAFVLVQYPLGDANKVLIEEIKKNKRVETKLRASKAYAELESDIRAEREMKNKENKKDINP